MELNFVSDNVVYLYRNPVDCIFSNLKYDGKKLEDRKSVDYYLNIWINHIQKWVYDEKFTKNKVILCYEKLQEDFVSEFSKLLNFFNIEVNQEKLIQSKEIYTKKKIKEIVEHDSKVINIEPNYEQERQLFWDLHSDYILSKLPDTHKLLIIK